MSPLTPSQAQKLLDTVRVASPCDVAWSSMTGTDRVRACALCQKHVYDLSSLTAVEAVALVQANEGRLCVRFWRREDGTMLTTDCPVGARRALLRRRERLAVSAVAMLALALMAAAPRPVKPRKHPVVVQGMMTCPPKQALVPIMGELVPPPKKEAVRTR